MKKRWRNPRTILLPVVIILVFTGAFLTGIGCQQFLDNRSVRNEFKNSSLQWKRDTFDGADDEVVRDIRNRELFANMAHIAMEQQIFFADADSSGEAGIANRPEASFSCAVSLMRDATGEIIYESGLIDPGFYIKTIHLNSRLKKGYYPCTAVWNFYTENGEYAGETAWKVVIIIEN